ncbi:hypothetical protein ACK3TF_004496 [Chlorella vulgaris]
MSSLRCGLRFLSTTAVCAARVANAPTMVKKSVYAVAAGRKPGLYQSWDECRRQVEGFPGNRFKGFGSEPEARRYLQNAGLDAAALHLEPAQAAAGSVGASGAAAGKSAAAPKAPQQRKRRAPRAAKAGGAHPVPVSAPLAFVSHTPQLSPNDRLLRMEFDGGSKGNPGPSGFGAVLYDEATGAEVWRLCHYMGDRHTNNQAEYAGLIAGLHAALALGCTRVTVLGDSTLIIQQVLGEWQVKHEGLRPYHAAATALRRRFAHFQARQVRREFNQVADALSNQAIDEFRSGANRQLWTLDTAEQHAAAAGLAAAEAQTHSQQPPVAQAVGGGDAGSSDGEAEGRPKTKRVPRR